MKAKYWHLGIPVVDKRSDMVYMDWGKFWKSQTVDAYVYKIEYLKFEEGTIFPEVLSKQFHVAYIVDEMEPFLDDADRVIFGPLAVSDVVRLAFVVKDDVIIEICENKKYLDWELGIH